ncbi:MAG: amidinotransferase [Prevotellaceae bacterium]|nr:amidinotransferase [Prevotellaceae bacterium]
MNMQASNTILMIEPVAFGFNEETAENNYFQQKDNTESSEIQQKALSEFNQMTDKLRQKGIRLLIVKDTPMAHTPDSIFPNNWVSFHEDGRIALYPMYAENRRKERRTDILEQLEQVGFQISNIVDYTSNETTGKFLEGTGSMILDRENNIAYAALSERTDKNLFLTFCKDFDFEAVFFKANQTVEGQRLPIYHTNVMMCVADKYAVVCLNTIDDAQERENVAGILKKSGKETIEISEEQMHNFAGNMLQVKNNVGESFLVMSQSTFDSLSEKQRETLSSYNEIIAVNIPTVEKYGGGSARCMMAEVFLPGK